MLAWATQAVSVCHVQPTNPYQHLNSLITYAKQRWGASMFYVDSNDAVNDAPVFAQLQSTHPDILLIPEHETLAHYPVSAPFHDARVDPARTPPNVRNVYPGAFSCINYYNIPTWNAESSQYIPGDILFFRGWYDDDFNDLVYAKVFGS